MISFKKLTSKEMVDKKIGKYTYVNPIIGYVFLVAMFATLFFTGLINPDPTNVAVEFRNIINE